MSQWTVEPKRVATPTIFVVDDDDAVRDSLKLLLESYGMAVEDYPSTAAFAQRYRPRARQCLVLDQHLPGATGLDFLSSPGGARLQMPVNLLTGRADDAIRVRAAALGVSAFLEKPIATSVLMAAIERALEPVGPPFPGRARSLHPATGRRRERT
jgi:two-component system response regulator FixJ